MEDGKKLSVAGSELFALPETHITPLIRRFELSLLYPLP